MESPGLRTSLRAAYLASSALVFVIQAIPALRRRFLAYGSRATSPKPAQSRPPNGLERLLDRAAALQVPHNYFTHFYVVSVASSLFWGWKLRLWAAGGRLPAVWVLMLLQGVRRLAESYVYTSSSKSRMWFAHWILGLMFYLATNVAVWAELPTGTAKGLLTAQLQQHVYHAYLYRLRTENNGYQLPSHPLFPNLLCPHYTCDIAVYVLLSLLGAPDGQIINRTLATAAIFTTVNLGVTAAGTKVWYEEKFGKDKVQGRRRMIPWLW